MMHAGQAGTYVKRVAIVTGAGRGIGEAAAQALARDGHAVALADLNVAEARRAASTFPATTTQRSGSMSPTSAQSKRSLTRSKHSLDRWRCWPASPAVRS